MLQDIRQRLEGKHGPLYIAQLSGRFDDLHDGHRKLIEDAFYTAKRRQRARNIWNRALLFVVSINSDESIRQLRGEWPSVPQDKRAAALRANRYVDEVIIFDESTPSIAIERLGTDLYMKGIDYESAPLPEQESIDRVGGDTAFVGPQPREYNKLRGVR